MNESSQLLRGGEIASQSRAEFAELDEAKEHCARSSSLARPLRV